MQQLLAADFYGWQSGARRAAATAGDADRTLLGGKSDGPGRKSGSGLDSTAADNSRKGGVAAASSGHEGGGGRWRGRGNNRNPVLGGFQRLRNVRGADGDWATRGEAAAPGETAGVPPSSAAATLQISTRDASEPAPGKGSPDWAAAYSASSGGVSSDDFNFEVSLDVEDGEGVYEDGEQEGEGGDESRQQGWRRGWMGGGNQDVTRRGGGGDGDGGGDGGGGPINWWG